MFMTVTNIHWRNQSSGTEPFFCPPNFFTETNGKPKNKLRLRQVFSKLLTIILRKKLYLRYLNTISLPEVLRL